MKKFALLLALIFILIGASAFADVPSVTDEVFAMDTYMTLTCNGEEAQAAIDDSIAEILRLDNLLSVGLENSEISQLNLNGSAVVSEDTAAMISEALSINAASNGAFEITILPVMELWGFTTDELHVPTDAELAEALAKVGSYRLTWDPENRSLTLDEGQSIDLGGIAKGYVSDRLWEIFEAHKLDSAIISLGGNVICYGTKANGNAWRVGIRSPYDSSAIIGVVEVDSGCVITSGDYERYFTDPETGKTYHHIIDPATGYPAESGLQSVTIVSDSGILADTLSTTCFIMGIDKSAEFWRSSAEDFDIIFFTKDDELYITDGLKNSFTSDNYPIHIIER